jgi:pyruvate dehydrogenase E1 component alpha subunit
VALNALLRDDDFVLSNHRGHGHYLARFGDADGLLAEIMGRAGAVCAGVGGSQHIYRDTYLSTGVQGESLPIGAGIALHYRRLARGRMVVVYVGDGTWGAGAVYEALNMACLWELPLLVVVENNRIAQSTPVALHMAGTVARRARAFDAVYRHVTTNDVNEIRAQLADVVDQVRTRPAPAVVEFDTVRVGAHSKGDDSRDDAARAAAAERDWYVGYRRAFPDQFDVADEEQRRYVDELVRQVERRPLVGRTA